MIMDFQHSQRMRRLLPAYNFRTGFEVVNLVDAGIKQILSRDTSIIPLIKSYCPYMIEFPEIQRGETPHKYLYAIVEQLDRRQYLPDIWTQHSLVNNRFYFRNEEDAAYVRVTI